MTIHDQIRDRIQAFAAELEALVRTAALDAVASSLGGASPTKTAAPGRAGMAAPKRATSRKKGGKRDPKAIAALVGRVAEYVKQHPGKGVEAIAAGLKLPTRELTLPITKLLGSKTITKKGQKRATKYFPT